VFTTLGVVHGKLAKKVWIIEDNACTSTHFNSQRGKMGREVIERKKGALKLKGDEQKKVGGCSKEYFIDERKRGCHSLKTDEEEKSKAFDIRLELEN